jgi:hypothetical protein
LIAVIQCAARKKADAGYFQSASGQRILFVARPDVAPASRDRVYALPDDLSDNGQTWRQRLITYNRTPSENPFKLARAIELYENATYERLASRLGLDRVFILSAGWGLIRADFLVPQYDITFSSVAEPYKRRRPPNRFEDLNQLPKDSTLSVEFFGGKDYVALFERLTRTYKGDRIVHFNSSEAPFAPGCTLRRFETRTRTNWHYECASKITERYR